MDSVEASIKSYYATRAPYYDAVYERPERREDIAFLKSYLPPRFAQRSVVEVACGTGYWTQFIAPAAASFTATELLPEPLQFAKARPGVDAVRFLQADAYALPELGRFDGAFAGLWLSHVPVRRRGEFLTSLLRLLSPGARVVFIDNSEIQCEEHPIVERDADGNSYQRRQLRDGSVHRVLKNFPKPAELEAMIVGFGARPVYRALQHFWLFEFEAGAAG
jgi:demethylmenaquinone methyltransferase/2-methoxy-6-polyprenyl-1,4-benzoquinol methylase